MPLRLSHQQSSSLHRKRRVDIYFVLYICVLALFTIEPKNEASRGIATGEQLVILPSPSELRCIIKISPSGKRRIEYPDSVITVQANTGSLPIRDLEYAMIVEGNSQLIPKDSSQIHNPSLMFAGRTDADNNMAYIHWRPNIPADTKTKSISAFISARAFPRDNYLFAQQIQTRVIVNFLIKVVNVPNEFDDMPSGSPSLSSNRNDSVGTSQPPFSNTMLTSNALSALQGTTTQISKPDTLYARADQQRVDAYAGGTWENIIQVFGAGPIKSPVITLSDGSSTYSASMSNNNTIKITGNAPISGTMTVNVEIKSWNDKYRTQTSFDVRTFPILEPKIPSIMYPGITEILDPQLPPTSNAEARLIDGTREVGPRVNGKFSYTPDDADINKTLELQRYLIGAGGSKKPIPTQARINVTAPAPEIVAINSTSKSGYKITIRCYGMVKRNGKWENNIIDMDRVQIDGDNLEYKELSGEGALIGQSNSATKGYSTQVIAFNPGKDNKKPMKIRRIILTDLRGKSVEWKP